MPTGRPATATASPPGGWRTGWGSRARPWPSTRPAPPRSSPSTWRCRLCAAASATSRSPAASTSSCCRARPDWSSRPAHWLLTVCARPSTPGPTASRAARGRVLSSCAASTTPCATATGSWACCTGLRSTRTDGRQVSPLPTSWLRWRSCAGHSPTRSSHPRTWATSRHTAPAPHWVTRSRSRRCGPSSATDPPTVRCTSARSRPTSDTSRPPRGSPVWSRPCSASRTEPSRRSCTSACSTRGSTSTARH